MSRPNEQLDHQYQTRNDDGECLLHPSFITAFRHATIVDKTVWKISWQDNRWVKKTKARNRSAYVEQYLDSLNDNYKNEPADSQVCYWMKARVTNFIVGEFDGKAYAAAKTAREKDIIYWRAGITNKKLLLDFNNHVAPHEDIFDASLIDELLDQKQFLKLHMS